MDVSENGVADCGFERRCGFRVPEFLVRFRTLDRSLAVAGRYTDLTVTVSELAAANPGATIASAVENLKCFLALPDVPGAIAIMGSGCAVTVLERVLVARRDTASLLRRYGPGWLQNSGIP